MSGHSELFKKYAKIKKEIKGLEEKIQFLNETKEDKKENGGKNKE